MSCRHRRPTCRMGTPQRTRPIPSSTSDNEAGTSRHDLQTRCSRGPRRTRRRRPLLPPQPPPCNRSHPRWKHSARSSSCTPRSAPASSALPSTTAQRLSAPRHADRPRTSRTRRPRTHAGRAASHLRSRRTCLGGSAATIRTIQRQPRPRGARRTKTPTPPQCPQATINTALSTPQRLLRPHPLRPPPAARTASRNVGHRPRRPRLGRRRRTPRRCRSSRPSRRSQRACSAR